MRKPWIPLATAALFAAAPLANAGAQNPNNELFLQSFTSGSLGSILTKIFVPNVTFAAGTGFDIRKFNGTTLGASLFYQVASTALVGGSLSLTPNLLLDPNTMYAIVLEINPSASPSPTANIDQAFAGGSIFTRSSASSAWVNSGYDVAGFAITTQTVTATPEPATAALLATGFMGIAGLAVRRRQLDG